MAAGRASLWALTIVLVLLDVGQTSVLPDAARAYAAAHGCDARLNAWCDANCPHAAAHGPLLARFDTTAAGHPPAWRCYSRGALSADTQRYERGTIFCTRDAQLRAELNACVDGHDVAGRAAAAPAPQCVVADAAQPSLPPAYEATGSERFLAFSVAGHEQLNKQRRALLHYMRLAAALGRTLVLPRVHVLRKDKRAWEGGASRGVASWYVPSGTGYFPLSAVYNTSRIAEYVPAVEIARLWQLSADDGVVPPADGPAVERAVERRIDVLFAADARVGHGPPCAPSADALVEFNGVRGVRAREVRCGLLHSEAPLRELAHVRTLGFADSFDQLPEAQATHLAPFLRFTDEISSAASAYVSRTFGSQPFLAVHWRRADFQLTRAARADVLLDARALIARVQAVLEQHGLRRLYLATDATEDEQLGLVRAALKPERVSWLADSERADMREAMDVANIGALRRRRPRCASARARAAASCGDAGRGGVTRG